MLERLAREFRKTDDLTDSRRANTVTAWLKKRGRDIPLSSVGIPELSAEPIELSESYRQASEALVEKDYSILEISIYHKIWQEPPQKLPDKFPKELHKKLPKAEGYFGYANISRGPSWFAMSIEVAVNPDELFLPDSFNLPQEQQIAMIQEHEKELKKDPRLQGVKVEMSAVSVYMAINTAYKEKHGKNLFRKYENCVADITDGEKVISVSGLDDRPEFQVQTEHKELGKSFIWRAKFTNDPHGWAVPVIVLPQKLAA